MVTDLEAKDQVPMEHSGAISWSLKEDMEAALNSPVSAGGHSKPKEENRDTTCRKSTPMPRADRFTPYRRASTSKLTIVTASGVGWGDTQAHTLACTRESQLTYCDTSNDSYDFVW